MFDIGFIELVLIGVVALVVVGPERLPKVASSVGRWVGRARRFVGNVKSDIEREIRQEQIREALGRDADLDEIKSIINDTKYTIEDEVMGAKQEYAVAARDDEDRSADDGAGLNQQQQIQEQEEDFDDTQLTDHTDNSDELDREFERQKAQSDKVITDDDQRNKKSRD